LREVLCSGARALLTQGVEAEILSFSQNMPVSRPRRDSGAWWRHGNPSGARDHDRHRPAVRQPRVRDRASGSDERIRYSPSILPRCARVSKSLEVLIPILYLKGISTGDFEEALAALIGKSLPLRRQRTRQSQPGLQMDSSAQQ